ncbi:DNA replication/repair protein RecF [Cecembia lonarensis]|uniref:DNA replication and repair protein RecF n=1 Tax=Cecembia lonarensis (strain CCUG 58316 / KCTC 22772 / LW9) TaxID=1225176 RepID=K1LDP7_CECL9|nr:DNA replication/repair protein RecF [Cecembia lonarensis]EKB50242.1 DNA replication and repair protein recF [Cecembia lonarensis LW9]
MYLKNIRLKYFKNYDHAEVQFSPEINCFVGINGSGKTNLLDAIHYLCLTKSAINGMDNLNVQHQKEFFTIFGDFELEGKEVEIKCIFESGKKKQLLQNGKAVEKMSDHVGLLPVVMIAPDDTQLIKDGSEERRRFFDNMLCQLSKSYMESLVRYQHFLKQRNALIKQFSERGRWDKNYISVYDKEIIALSKQIALKRAEFIKEYEPLLRTFYAEISGNQEDIGISYDTHCLGVNFEQEFFSMAQKDFILKRTNKGIHKDDFVFEIKGYPLKKFGSQGQQKSFLIALKLAQFQIFLQHKGTKPILLLDDIFDKLDDHRIQKLMQLVADHRFGQLFISDARPERSKAILRNIASECTFFSIKDGVLKTGA